MPSQWLEFLFVPYENFTASKQFSGNFVQSIGWNMAPIQVCIVQLFRIFPSISIYGSAYIYIGSSERKRDTLISAIRCVEN